MKRLLYLLFAIVLWNCTHNSETEKYQKKRDNITNVRGNIKEIEITDVLIGSLSRVYIFDNYLIIKDYMSYDEQIHIFDKNTFAHIISTGRKGQGPGEIANIGHIGVNNADRIFYVSDHGKQCIFSYSLDSVLVNPQYLPEVKMRMNEKQFPDKYQYINDTLCIGLIIEPIGYNDFKPSVAKWNMNTGEINMMKYEHPDIEKKRIAFAASVDHGIYVECYYNHDLMTICTLNDNGKLKYNVYGENWSNGETNRLDHYGKVAFCGDKILALYCGRDSFYKDSKRGIVSNYPTKFLVFDLNGDYIKTLETGYQITHFCYDEENNRIIMNMDDEIQFAYLGLDGLIM